MANTSGALWAALAGFIVLMFFPWLISSVHRLWKKKPSSSSHFAIYYVILFLWFIVIISRSIMLHTSLDLNFWSKFESNNRFSIFMTAVFFLLVFYVFRYLVIKANKIKPTKSIVAPNPISIDKDFIIRIRRRKRKLYYILGIIFIIIVIYLLIT
ncbi:MAG TPA: hypothetical protein PK073_09825 [Ignavibacteriaceae bacterium]|jgi:hypothetical protein|nr:MAG: hypothetical protein BWY38_01298 [Ignavibacteria bacterium ADurb.Bin266]OQY75641.1 MAG: hypothetical protein B6D44_00970 [Ignavibacteriales bacterium UTCHB2]HQF43197.1 hypothetical protein [Ignavibacteriaceae bacterium]HQI40302.1 hypothetical protein [Ignavibacteriaceae bacterium]